MSDEQVFEFKGNALMHFRVGVRPASLTVSTLKKKGGAPVKTWDVAFSRIAEVRIAERRGARTRRAAVFLKEKDGTLVMFGWQKNAAGASLSEASSYYSAAVATLRAIANERPDLSATMGPYAASTLIGMFIGAVLFTVLTYLLIGEVNLTFRVTAAAIIATYTIGALSSGAFAKTRRLSLHEAADVLAAQAPAAN